MKKIAIISFLLTIAGLLAAQWIWIPRQNKIDQRQWSDRINLAMRQTAHILLAAEGNDTSTIEPVRHHQMASEFSLKMENGFDYDTLPYVLENALKSLGVSEPYYVSITGCETGDLILGYHLAALENKEIACRGREQNLSCSIINITFDKKEWHTWKGPLFWSLTGWLMVLVLVQVYFNRKNKTSKRPASADVQGDKIVMGSTVLHFKNQYLVQDGVKKNLTFRENKLLHHFAKHPDQVLKREEILAAVWGDEGLIVGRSLDVFVSRLRKALEGDGSVAIKNVHGVGYRLEVKK